MPDLRILKALGMTPADWGQVPFDGNARILLREKALRILAGQEPPPETASDVFRAKEQAIIDAQRSDILTRSGFESAMVQQAKQFGEAVEQLRESLTTVSHRCDFLAQSDAELVAKVLAIETALEHYSRKFNFEDPTKG